MSDWTHPICVEDFLARQPDREPSVITLPYRDRETCCFCGRDTDAGIYIRENPTAASFHPAAIEEATR